MQDDNPYLYAVITQGTDISVRDCGTSRELAKWFNRQDWTHKTLRGFYPTEDAAGRACKRIHQEWFG